MVAEGDAVDGYALPRDFGHQSKQSQKTSEPTGLPDQPSGMFTWPGPVDHAKCPLVRFSAFNATKSHASQGTLRNFMTLTS
jgi:hypothetical protein